MTQNTTQGQGGAGRGPQGSDQSRKDAPPHGGAYASLEELGYDELRRVAAWVDGAGHVYEHDPGRRGYERSLAERIGVVEIDEDRKLLLLERAPGTTHLRMEPDTYQIQMMINAIRGILYEPRRHHLPLRKIFHDRSRTTWPGVDPAQVDKWFFLRDGLEGVDEQRQFVRIALGTPDFAFLEGPPGSGKTAVLCELVLQMAVRGKRVMFCASTHVAVDNLVERIAGAGEDISRHVVAIRVGTSDKISGEASRYGHDAVAETIRREMRSGLTSIRPRSRAQDLMLSVIDGREGGGIGQMARDHANLVCGTTIGLLAHPDMRRGTLREFDMMVIDEASKTTMQEFLVPAVHARRWIVVGDTMQLAPHTDQEDMAMQIGAAIDDARGAACLDVFLAKARGRAVAVADAGADTERAYEEQCGKLDVRLRRPGDGGGPVKGGEVVIGAANKIRKAFALPKGIVWRGEGGADAAAAAPPSSGGAKAWAEEVAWRVSIQWPGKDGGGAARIERLRDEVDMLMPQEEGEEEEEEIIRPWVDRVERIAVPSVLQLVQRGFHSKYDGDGDTVLRHGMPPDAFGERHVRLKWQHRMHRDIARFSHLHVYGGEALRTPDAMDGRRNWQYGRYPDKALWIDVSAGGMRGVSGSPSNEAEADCIGREVAEFVRFAAGSPRPEGGPWEVAVLSFYNGQMEPLRRRLASIARVGGGGSGGHTFSVARPGGRGGDTVAKIMLRTVDSFQGHEADLVFLSLANSRPTIFLNNPNRLNVALTRARYQCVVVGDRGAMAKSDPPLGDLAAEMQYWKEAV